LLLCGAGVDVAVVDVVVVVVVVSDALLYGQLVFCDVLHVLFYCFVPQVLVAVLVVVHVLGRVLVVVVGGGVVVVVCCLQVVVRVVIVVGVVALVLVRVVVGSPNFEAVSPALASGAHPVRERLAQIWGPGFNYHSGSGAAVAVRSKDPYPSRQQQQPARF